LQIRVGRFDSGPRLHSNEPLFNHSGFSFGQDKSIANSKNWHC